MKIGTKTIISNFYKDENHKKNIMTKFKTLLILQGLNIKKQIIVNAK